MNINWEHGSSANKPDEVCLDWSPKNVYLHRNFEQVEEPDAQGGTRTIWEYEQARIPRADYAIYAAENADAKAEYIAMMTDVDLMEG